MEDAGWDASGFGKNLEWTGNPPSTGRDGQDLNPWNGRTDGMGVQGRRGVLSYFSPVSPPSSLSNLSQNQSKQIIYRKKIGLIKRRKAKKGGNLHFPTLQGLIVRSFSESIASLEL